MEARDSKGALTLTGFDLLHRPSRLWARDGRDGAVTLRQRVEYGDGGDPHQAEAARQALPRPQPARPCDPLTTTRPGSVTTGGHDFKGNPLSTTRQVIADAPILATYTAGGHARLAGRAVPVDWTPAPAQTQDARDTELLDPAGYTPRHHLRRA